ncbi:MAG: YhcN/YlaJ family sporulation lipoprotein [Epulopiscium sp.]|nr:YhcN/YlaJ family sporulation lipoprotein [Candidatus Epulonipiscium sp.]
MRKNFLIARFILGFIFIIICSGCRNMDHPEEKGTDETIENNLSNLISDGSQRMSEHKTISPYRTPDTVMEATQYTETAKKLATIIVEMPEVEKATVLITGNTALVGIGLTQELSNEELDMLKQEIQGKVQKQEGRIDFVSVTNAKELVEKMTMIAQDVSGGRPIQGLADEIGAILRRITPTI